MDQMVIGTCFKQLHLFQLPKPLSRVFKTRRRQVQTHHLFRLQIMGCGKIHCVVRLFRSIHQQGPICRLALGNWCICQMALGYHALSQIDHTCTTYHWCIRPRTTRYCGEKVAINIKECCQPTHSCQSSSGTIFFISVYRLFVKIGGSLFHMQGIKTTIEKYNMNTRSSRRRLSHYTWLTPHPYPYHSCGHLFSNLTWPISYTIKSRKYGIFADVHSNPLA